MMRGKLRTLSMVGLLLFSLANTGKVIAGINNANSDAFVSQSEYKSVYDNYVDVENVIIERLEMIIAEGISNQLSESGVGTLEDAIYPIGTVIINNVAPDFGTWEEVKLGSIGCALYLGKTTGQSFGKTETEWASKWLLDMDEKTMNKITWGRQTLALENGGKHDHSIKTRNGYERQMTHGGGQEMISNIAREIYNDTIYTKLPTTAMNHAHNITVNITENNYTHTHTITEYSDSIYDSNQEHIQPDAFVVKLWKRIA